MESKQVYLTPEGKIKLEQELRELKGKLREIADRIDKAKELGDLSENAEYHEAKEDYAFTQGKIMQIEFSLSHCVLVNPHTNHSKVDIGSRITIVRNGKETVYKIVGSNEADPAQGRISNESPLGRAFLGKQKGDTVEVKTPGGVTEYRIAEIA